MATLKLKNEPEPRKVIKATELEVGRAARGISNLAADLIYKASPKVLLYTDKGTGIVGVVDDGYFGAFTSDYELLPKGTKFELTL